MVKQIQSGVPIYDKTADGTTVKGLPKGYSYSNTLDTAIQKGDYDNGIKGLQQQLKVDTTPGPLHIPPSTVSDLNAKITQLKVLQDNKIPPSLMDTYAKTDVTEWRALGDPSSSTYNPALYQQLYQLDSDLAAKGVADTSLASATSNLSGKSTNKYTSSSSSSSGSGVSSSVKDNTIKSRIQPTHLNLSTTELGKNVDIKIPQIKLTTPNSLIKAHKIGVVDPHGSYN